MQIKTTPPVPNLKLGLGVLALGIAIGLVAKPKSWLGGPAPAEDAADLTAVELQVPMARPAEALDPAVAFPAARALKTLSIDVAPADAEVLQRVYERSWETGMIVQQEGDLVPASFSVGAKTIPGHVRIKGDYLDHLATNKWSLRVELGAEDKLFGMPRFSIQHPNTRGYLWEWLIMKAGRRAGVITPRVDFVNVVVNDNPLGIYYLEEHYTKELLEAQGRREGPIMRFDERVLMEVYDQYVTEEYFVPETVRPGTLPTAAETSAFGEKRIARSEGLSRALERSIAKLSVLQAGVLRLALVQGSAESIRQALERAGSETLASAFDFESAARMNAIYALFRCSHGLGWKDRLFYYNPITDRLEPIMNDTLAGTPGDIRDPISMYTHVNEVLMENDDYFNELFVQLGKVADPAYLTGVFAELEGDLRRYSAIMAAEGIAGVDTDVDAIKERLWDQQVYLRNLLDPVDAINFDARLLGDGGPGGELVIEAWATTRVPVVLRGFRFQNGRFVPAERVLEPSSDGCSRVRSDPGAVVLPHDDRHAAFRFQADLRLATLQDVEALKAAVLTESEKDKSTKLRVTAEYRLLTDATPRGEDLMLRRFGASWADEGQRPAPPSLAEALAAHGFLAYSPETRELVALPGEWDVQGDLVVPDGHPLRIGPGTTLRFGAAAALVSNEPLLFDGTAERPIRLEPQPGIASWSGIAVLQAPGTSAWHHVEVRGTDVIRRGGWTMTGGVTFYRCPVELYDCAFRDAVGEDALNVFGAECLLDGVLIDSVASDAFDGDFVTGAVRNSTFRNTVEDAIDVSGSDIDVHDCRFAAIGDKGISAGEDSVVRARDCIVESASIGLASKDFSRLTAERIEIRQATNYGIAVYVKKPEFGPSSVRADGIVFGAMGLGRHVVQDPCELVLEGERIPGVELDVAELYRRKILGQ
jgi:hypothetical protein